MKDSRLIGVIGAAQPSESGYAVAREVGRLLGEAGAVLVCGGLGGVMEAACRGCREAGGQTVGILPGTEAREANPWVAIPIVTGMGHARNVIIAHSAKALIAVEGEYGTISEMAIALKLGRPVVTLQPRHPLAGTRPAHTPAQAVSLALAGRDEDKEGFDAC